MSDKEMIDRVAKALCDFDLTEDAWHHTGEFDCKEDYRALARIAIKAMREPTQKMLDGGCNVTNYDDDWVGDDLAKDVYQAMIDAVIND